MVIPPPQWVLPLHALLRHRRPHVATESRQLLPVAAVDLSLGVQVDIERFAHRLGRCRSAPRALGL